MYNMRHDSLRQSIRRDLRTLKRHQLHRPHIYSLNRSAMRASLIYVMCEYNSDSSHGYYITARYCFENSLYIVYGSHKSNNRSVLRVASTMLACDVLASYLFIYIFACYIHRIYSSRSRATFSISLS